VLKLVLYLRRRYARDSVGGGAVPGSAVSSVACLTIGMGVTAGNLSLQFPVTAGQQYAIEIAGLAQTLANAGRLSVNVQVLPTVTIASGARAFPRAFTATVTGTRPTSRCVAWRGMAPSTPAETASLRRI